MHVMSTLTNKNIVQLKSNIFYMSLKIVCAIYTVTLRNILTTVELGQGSIIKILV